MFPEVEEAIVNRLREEFKDDLFLKPSMITSSKLQKEELDKPKGTLPAIRVVFVEMNPQSYAEVEGDYYAGELVYTVLFFFRSFQMGSSHVYGYLQRIVNTLKGLETPRGKVSLGRLQLIGGEGFYVYSLEVKVPAFV